MQRQIRDGTSGLSNPQHGRRSRLRPTVEVDLIPVFVFLGSGYASWTEFRFLTWGRPIEAMIERAREDVDKQHVSMYYRFTKTSGQGAE